MVIMLNAKILLVRPKLQMADDGLYREGRYFQAYDTSKGVQHITLPSFIQSLYGQETALFGQVILDLKDTCIGFECCEELWQPLSQNIELFT